MAAAEERFFLFKLSIFRAKRTLLEHPIQFLNFQIGKLRSW